MDIDPGILLNLIFCIITLCLGITAYTKRRMMWPLLLGIAFAFFGISHLFVIIGIEESQEVVMVVTRAIGYLLTLYTMYWFGCRKYA